MSRMLEINVTSATKDGKKRYTRVGVAFENTYGGWDLRIDPGVSIHSAEGVYVSLREKYNPDAKPTYAPRAAPVVHETAGQGTDDFDF